MVFLLQPWLASCADDHSAGAWSIWETSTSKLIVDPEYIKKAEDPKWYANLSLGIKIVLTIFQGTCVRSD